MSKTFRLQVALFCACAVVLFIPDSGYAQDRDTQEVMAYTLTEAGLAKYVQATRNLAELPETCDEDDSDSQSIDQSVAKLNAHPAAKAAVQSAGMTTREYVVFSWSIIHNGLTAWALSQPGGKLPAGTSKANVDFYKKHEAGLKSLGSSKSKDACADDRSDEESEE
ncbi:MAG: hypothetical protein WAW79_04215 [Steroidobacteraceae bacterium]